MGDVCLSLRREPERDVLRRNLRIRNLRAVGSRAGIGKRPLFFFAFCFSSYRALNLEKANMMIARKITNTVDGFEVSAGSDALRVLASDPV